MIITAKDFKAIKSLPPGDGFCCKVDFGTREVSCSKDKASVLLDGRYRLSLAVDIKENFCYRITRDGIMPVAFFSEETNMFYKLRPTPDWPTVTIGSVPMHRVGSVFPKRDTENKIRMLQPRGIVLDTCMGLGYTAIAAARTSRQVHTFEIDANVYFIAGINPISQSLFKNEKIKIYRADVGKYIHCLKSNYFDAIIHDPPTFTIAPHLYSGGFYSELHRVLKRRGKMFHYTPWYGSKRGLNFPLAIRRKLKEAGFAVLRFAPERGGILCQRRLAL